MKPDVSITIVVHDTPAELNAAVAQRIEEIVQGATRERGVARVALAGGETPRGCYECLRQSALNWGQIHIYFGDERCLPYGDVRRNDHMAYEALLRHIDIPQRNIHPILAERGARVAALEYAELLERALPLDLVLLGMGEDGHTASLFPGSAATEQDDTVVPVFDAPKWPAQRVSLGLRSLNGARSKLFLVAGEAKRHALAQIVRGVSMLPAARVAAAEWHVDRAALPNADAAARL